MSKVKVSFDGKMKADTWEVDVENTVGEPHLEISRHSRSIKLVFETHRERERFGEGVAMCRAKYEEEGKVREIYITKFR
jgi:hypothetical protein